VSVLFARSWAGPQDLALIALAASSVGVALYAGARLAGPGRQRLWFAGGLTAGTAAVLVWLR
jgi:hypothetical protein